MSSTVIQILKVTALCLCAFCVLWSMFTLPYFKLTAPKSVQNGTSVTRDARDDRRPGRFKIGILIPATSRKIESKRFRQTPLYKASIPSILNTIEPEFDYSIYVGIDRGDKLETQLPLLINMSRYIIPVIVNSTNYVTTVNAIAAVAYNNGEDYLVRTNDDTVFITQNWTWAAIVALQAFSPPNIGVVGPTCRQGNVNILTHDMVHRTHLSIFGTYYPTDFTNWSSDTWMTIVYGPERTRKLSSWTVIHTQMYGMRYTPQADVERKTRLKSIKTIDKKKIVAYIDKLMSM